MSALTEFKKSQKLKSSFLSLTEVSHFAQSLLNLSLHLPHNGPIMHAPHHHLHITLAQHTLKYHQETCEVQILRRYEQERGKCQCEIDDDLDLGKSGLSLFARIFGKDCQEVSRMLVRGPQMKLKFKEFEHLKLSLNKVIVLKSAT